MVHRRFQASESTRISGGGQEKSSLHELPTFEEALLAHLDGLFAFALRLVGGQRAQAEDLVQEVCLKAFRSYSSLRSPGKFKSWLFQILVNTHLNEFQRQSREAPIVDVELSDVLLDRSSLDWVQTPEEQLFDQLLDSEVQQA